MHKVVVLGGAGAMGRVIVHDLAETSSAEQIVIADFNKDAADDLAKRVGGSKVSAAFADLQDSKSLASVFQGSTIVINSTPYYFNIAVMEAALGAGCHYLDLGGLFHVTGKQLELNERFEQKKLTAVLGMGAAPGMTNVMAQAGADQLDCVDSIDIVVGAIDFVEVDHPLAAPYALDTILDEYTKEPMVFENGEYLAKPPMSGEVSVNLAAPVGTCSAILTLHSEVLTLPQTYKNKGIKSVTFRLGLPQAFHEKLKLLVDIGFGGSEKINVENVQVTPRKVLARLLDRFPASQQDPDDCEVVRVDVRGKSGGQNKLVRLETTVLAHKLWKLSCGALDTGVPPSIVAEMIIKGEIHKRGVLAPETCVPAAPFFAELSKRSIDIQQEVIELEPASVR